LTSPPPSLTLREGKGKKGKRGEKEGGELLSSPQPSFPLFSFEKGKKHKEKNEEGTRKKKKRGGGYKATSRSANKQNNIFFSGER